ncbi:MAG: AN1-type zinc finger domain-containing protein [Promethearchaeota archaeon]
MVKCSYCGKEIYMPFKCRYCGGNFCSDHRLPEAHECKNLIRGPEHRNQVVFQPHNDYEVDHVTPGPVQQEYLGTPSDSEDEIPFSNLSEEWEPQFDEDIPENIIDIEEYKDPVTGETMIRYYVYDNRGFRKIFAPWGYVKKPIKPILGITSKREIWQLSIATLIIFGITLSMFLLIFYPLFVRPSYPPLMIIEMLLTSVALGVLAFIGHELAHKFASIKQGYWSEFRLTPFFTIISAASIFLPFKFALPGAVMIPPQAQAKKTMGKIALAGPMYNLVFGIALLACLFIFGKSSFLTGLGLLNGFQTPIVIGVFLNFFLGLFNLVPIAILDGRKIIKWSKGIWMVSILIMLIAIGVLLVGFWDSLLYFHV